MSEEVKEAEVLNQEETQGEHQVLDQETLGYDDDEWEGLSETLEAIGKLMFDLCERQQGQDVVIRFGENAGLLFGPLMFKDPEELKKEIEEMKEKATQELEAEGKL